MIHKGCAAASLRMLICRVVVIAKRRVLLVAVVSVTIIHVNIGTINVVAATFDAY